MDLFVWLFFVGMVMFIVFIFGFSVLLVIVNSMKYGVKKIVGIILGDLSVNLCQIVLVLLGLVLFVIFFGVVFQFIKWCGVVYLIYMGLFKIFSKV